jgi:hypothetical protein
MYQRNTLLLATLPAGTYSRFISSPSQPGTILTENTSKPLNSKYLEKVCDSSSRWSGICYRVHRRPALALPTVDSVSQSGVYPLIHFGSEAVNSREHHSANWQP